MMNMMNKFSTETQRTQSYTEKNAQRRDVACRVLSENVSLGVQGVSLRRLKGCRCSSAKGAVEEAQGVPLQIYVKLAGANLQFVPYQYNARITNPREQKKIQKQLILLIL